MSSAPTNESPVSSLPPSVLLSLNGGTAKDHVDQCHKIQVRPSPVRFQNSILTREKYPKFCPCSIPIQLTRIRTGTRIGTGTRIRTRIRIRDRIRIRIRDRIRDRIKIRGQQSTRASTQTSWCRRGCIGPDRTTIKTSHHRLSLPRRPSLARCSP